MIGLLKFIALLVFISFVLYKSNKAAIKIVSVAMGTLIYAILGGSILLTLGIFAILIATTFVTYADPFRKETISRFFYTYVKHQLPPMSETEQIALEAGGSSIEQSVFQAKCAYDENYNLTDGALTEEEQTFIDETVPKLCSMLNEWDINMNLLDLPENVWKFIKKEGFLGMAIPKEHGGLGFSALAHSMVVNKIASVSGTAAVTVMVPNSLGPAELLLHYGTDEQKHHYLPRLAAGKEIPCFALTSTTAGSDATSIKDSGVVCERTYKGKKTKGVLLNFEKRYITLAPVATLIGLAFKLYDPDHLLGEQEELGITLAIVPRETDGIEVGNRHYPMFHSFMNGPVCGEDVFIPLDMIIGGEARIGEGWKMLMECLAIGRGISLPALGNATSKVAYIASSAYAMVREQFGRSIADFEGINVLLGKLGGYAYLSEAQRRMTLHEIDANKKPSLLSAITKLHLTEMGRESINDTLDIMGGKAIQAGPNNLYVWGYLAIPVAITVEGANILTRNLIVFGQGLMRCHEHIRSLIDLVYQPETEEVKDKFDESIFAFINGSISHVAGVFLNHFTRGWQEQQRFNPEIANESRYHYMLCNKLALVSDLCLATMGGALKVKEATSARLGDALSYLSMHYALQRYYLNHNNSEERIYFEWASAHCLHEAESALIAVLDNMPNPWIGRALKLFVFPMGANHKAPSDKLCNKLGKLSHQSHLFRDRILKQVHLNEQGELLEDTFRMKNELLEPYKRIIKAVKSGTIDGELYVEQQIDAALEAEVINQEEHKQLTKLFEQVFEIISVDEFDSLKKMARQEIA